MAAPHQYRPIWQALLVGLLLFQSLEATPAQAQEPPLAVPIGGTLSAKSGTAIPFETWLLYPSIRLYSAYSDNLFNSPEGAIAAWGFGESPALTAEWSNGIHSTTLHASLDQETYPTFHQANRLDWDTSFTQKYEPLRDLTFRLNGDVSHATVASALQNAIPTAVSTSETRTLPNGDILLPNGLIISPTGAIVGHTTPTVSVNGTSLINPHNQYTGTLSIDKIFNHGVLDVSGSVNQTIYEQQSSSLPDSTAKSLTEHAGVWLGPVFYLYSDGSIANTSAMSAGVQPAGPQALAGPTTAYTITGGIGSRQIGLVRGNLYFGHQGSSGPGTSHGEIFGASATYYPTSVWILSASFNQTTNISSSSSQLALTLPSQVPVQIPLSASARITSTSFSSSYTLSPQWSTSESIGYSRIENGGSTPAENAWSAGATLSHAMRHDLFISWQYQYTALQSPIPQTSSKQNLLIMSANHNF